MKLITETKSIKTNYDNSRGADLGIDAEDIGIVLGFLSDGIYSNGVGSIVREYVSNAYDAHIEEGTDDPIQVIIASDSMGTYFAVKDFGCGMGEDEINTYFKKYGKSSKRDTNSQLGAFGLGSKAFQAETDAVYYTTIKDGVERAFALFKATPAPRYEPIHEVETTERNGTTVKIYLSDSNTFKYEEECKLQLSYFKNVFFDIKGFNNNYKIVDGDKFIYSSAEPNYRIHAVLGNVAYPLDFDKLGMSWKDSLLPIGVKFDIGELNVTISREDIRYNEESIKLIKQRISEAKSELIELYNQSRTEYKSYKDYILNYESKKHYLDLGGNHIDIDSIVKRWLKEDETRKLTPVLIKGYGETDFRNFRLSEPENRIMKSISVIKYINQNSGRYLNIPSSGENHFNFYNAVDSLKYFCLRPKPIYIQNGVEDKRLNKQIAYDHKENVYILSVKPISHSDSIPSLFDSLENQVDNLKKRKKASRKLTRLLIRLRDELLSDIQFYDDLVVDESRIEEIVSSFKVRRGGSTVKDLNSFNIKTPYTSNRGISLDAQKLTKEELLRKFENYSYVIYAKSNDGEAVSRLKRLYDGSRRFRSDHSILLLSASARTIESIKTIVPNKGTMIDVWDVLKTDYFESMKHESMRNHITLNLLKDVDRWDLKQVDDVISSNFHSQYKEVNDVYKNVLPLEWYSLTEIENDIKNLSDINVSQEIIDKCLVLSDVSSKFDFLKYFKMHEIGSKEFILDYMECKGITIE